MPKRPTFVRAMTARLLTAFSRIRVAATTKWQAVAEEPHLVTGGFAVAALAFVVVAAYYVNQPKIPHDPDSPVYAYIASQIAHGHLVSTVRTPGYPLFLNFMALAPGHHPLRVASVAQGLLFVLVAIGVYALAFLLLRRAWAAVLIAIPVATNVILISYVEPIMTEAQAMVLLVCLALVVVWFVLAPAPPALWLSIGVLFVLAMTRPEWVYFAVPLVGFLLLVSWQRDVLKRILPHAIVAAVLFAGLCGLYVYANAQQGYVGFGENQNVDLLGKVMQYHMVHETPPQYAAITAEVERFLARGDYDPWHVVAIDPVLQRNHYAVDAEYGRAIIEQHPVEFVADTIPLVFASLLSTGSHQPLAPHGAFGSVLLGLQGVATLAQFTLVLFPFIAILWWVRLFRRRRDPLTAAMAGITLLCVYPLAVTTLFVYTQYTRMNAPYDALMIVVVWGSVIWLARPAAQSALSRLRLALETGRPAGTERVAVHGPHPKLRVLKRAVSMRTRPTAHTDAPATD